MELRAHPDSSSIVGQRKIIPPYLMYSAKFVGYSLGVDMNLDASSTAQSESDGQALLYG